MNSELLDKTPQDWLSMGFGKESLTAAGSKFRFHFDFDQHLGINEGAHFDHRGAGANFIEKLVVGTAILLPA